MPRIIIREPFGMCYHCDTRQCETVLKEWFDEILPIAFAEDPQARRGTLWPHIDVWPMIMNPSSGEPDWLMDTRVLGRWEIFPARNGEEGMRELQKLRERLELELEVKR